MAAVKFYQILLLFGCVLLAVSFNKNDILYEDEKDALLQKYLYYLQGLPEKWEEYDDDDDDDDDESMSEYEQNLYDTFLSESEPSEEDAAVDEDEVIPDKDGFEVNLRMPDVRPKEVSHWVKIWKI